MYIYIYTYYKYIDFLHKYIYIYLELYNKNLSPSDGVFSDHSLIPRLGDQRFAEAGDRAMRQILQAQTHRTWWCHIKPYKWHYKWVTGATTPISL